MSRAPTATTARSAASSRPARPARPGAKGAAARRGQPAPALSTAVKARRRLVRRIAAWLLMGTVWGGLALGVLLLIFAWDLPRPEAALETTRRPSVTLEAADGRLLSTSGDLYGETVRLRDLPIHLPTALLAIEDRRFRDHFGLDPVGVMRAAWVNLTTGRVAQGGSTLTQQLAKNLFLTPERSYRRKVQEAMLALWLESRFTKDQLLEIYLNRVYLGAGAYGVDAAARLYFGVPARRLTIWQSAVLAGLPRAPSRYNPRANPVLAAERGAEVLRAMATIGALTEAQAAAEAERIAFPRRPSRDSGWFADWVHEDLATRFPGSADLMLRTTLDLRVQAVVEAKLEALLSGPGAAADVGQGAVVVLDAATGAVRAMAGGRDYRRSAFNRAVSARRQPGSVFKPFVYLAALEKGLHPESTVSDAPITLGRWSPGNGNWRARGDLPLEEALAHSVNTSAVRVLVRAGGAKEAAAVARRLGLAGPFPRDATIALGTGEASLLELAAAYAAFANGGMRVTPYGIASVRAEGRALPAGIAAPARAVQPDDALAIRRMMEAVVSRGSGRVAAVPGRSAAGKTGTTQDFRDAWFIGFSGNTVIGVWLGNDDATPMDDVRGGTLPARLFHDILEGLPR
ncbi:transglycosylase domain-containing protein [Roseomonas xinghualingensis]|uniref:transglycosylase domain-containing protein n=1 Tax=Roseomonas xinghualingensis TaxID=2986475 RepID=UPI0021F0E2AF|nr:PBP1A family penicillin-binding protein [Roseomonas sp. SXEYE001]MCV4208388.1 PBP1A family penicillin-binding protein [Roseomonas sp. SXEYE001]